MSREQQEQLHRRAQDALRCHVVTAAVSHRRQQHRDALIAQLDMDASLLLSTYYVLSTYSVRATVSFRLTQTSLKPVI